MANWRIWYSFFPPAYQNIKKIGILEAQLISILKVPFWSRKAMSKRTTIAAFTAVTLRAESDIPLYRQLYDELREAILQGRLSAGSRLPSTRWLADTLKISRNTVVTAFDQLLAEGYIESRVGDGTYITRVLPEEVLNSKRARPAQQTHVRNGRALSTRGTAMGRVNTILTEIDLAPRAFRTGIPALEEFPHKLWSQLEGKYQHDPRLMAYGDSAGYRPLRIAIAEYLREARAVRCSPDQVIVVAGAQQAFDLAARLLLDSGDAVWIENPGYGGARAAFLGAGAQLVPVGIDSEGLNVADGLRRRPDARLAYVTPSHQYPLGVTLSLSRRFALLDWAYRAGAWIIEDDYNSEYRYASHPLAALQGLDRENRVIYVGTFSKVLLPALRLGYMVVPPDLVEPFIAGRAILSRHSSLRDQAVVADFIAEGHFTTHIRRMRALYAQRQQVLVEAARAIPDNLLTIHPADAGMHVMGWLPDGWDDRNVTAAALEHDVEVTPLSRYCIESVDRAGVVLGYACVNESAIRAAVTHLAAALSEYAALALPVMVQHSS
jgi:GntR family transcriptional regulator/MocR family aminotransferase